MPRSTRFASPKTFPALTRLSQDESLVGQFVQVVDVEPPTIAPPTEPSATPFNFDSRTDTSPP